MRHGLFTAAAVAAGLIAAPVSAQQVGATLKEMADSPIVTIRATDMGRSRPDIASVSVGVQTLAPTATQSLADNSAKMERLLAAVRASGIPEAKIQTSGIRLEAKYRYLRNDDSAARQFAGYEVSNSVRVTTTDLTGLGKFLDAMVAAGGTSINGPSFAIANSDLLRREGRSRALAKADEEAAFYARARGYARARLVAIDEANSVGEPIIVSGSRSFTEGMMVSAPPIAPGEVPVSVTLTVRYILEK